MPTSHDVLSALDAERFSELVSASPKKFREELYRRAGIRVKSDAFSLKGSPKNEVRAQKLHALLRGGLQLGDQVLEELIRNYLYTRRTLLADALDYFEVPHENGLTDSELDFIEKLKPEDGRALRENLALRHDGRDVDLYLAFMNIPCA